MQFNSRARADGLVRRVLRKREMMEMFEGRFDHLLYRHVSFSVPDGLSDVHHIPLKVKSTAPLRGTRPSPAPSSPAPPI